MAKRIFVGGLTYSTSDQDLQNLFAQSGAVTSASIVTDRNTGESKGFGFVDMENDTEAAQAISKLHGTQFGQRTLTVNEAKPREQRSGGGGYGGGGNRGGYGGNRGGRY
jgi:RNA recognition motif-containing protein